MTVRNTSRSRSIGLLIAYYVCLSFWVRFVSLHTWMFYTKETAVGMRNNRSRARVSEYRWPDKKDMCSRDQLRVMGRRKFQ